MTFPKFFYVLGLHPVNARHPAVSRVDLVQQMIELRVDRLGVPVLRSLDEDGHHPRREGCDRMPVETVGREDQPK